MPWGWESNISLAPPMLFLITMAADDKPSLTSGKKKYSPPTVTEVWDEQIGTRGVYLLELG